MLEYQGVRIPNKILVTDPIDVYYNRVLELFLEEPWAGSELMVFKIKDTGDDWYWPEDIACLEYLDYERVKDLLAFI